MDFKKLIVFKKTYNLAMDIFEISKSFPKEETYSLTDQIKRSSRSVCSCIAEAYRKRMYPKYFANKISDADGENFETNVWLEFARDCGYITKIELKELTDKNIEVGKLINHMIYHPENYGVKLNSEN